MVWRGQYRSPLWLYELQTLIALIKLSRKMAIFEFSSSNGFSSFTLYFECLFIEVREVGDENNYHFSYLVYFPMWTVGGDTSCDKRGFETSSILCTTTFQG